MSIKESEYHLNAIKEYMSIDEYRLMLATLYAKYYAAVLRSNKMSVTRMRVMDRVNFVLRSKGLDELSYSFFRKFEL